MTLIFVGSVPQGSTMLDPLPMRWERRPHPPPHTGCAPGLVQVRLREAAAGRGLQPRGDRRAPRASLSPPQQRLLYPQVLHRPVGLSPTPGSCWWCRTASAPSLGTHKGTIAGFNPSSYGDCLTKGSSSLRELAGAPLMKAFTQCFHKADALWALSWSRTEQRCDENSEEIFCTIFWALFTVE